jgi:hypothetical protein
MRRLAIGLMTAAGLALAAPAFSAENATTDAARAGSAAAQTDTKGAPADGKAAMQKPAKSKATSKHARGSYAQGHRRHIRRGGSAIAQDPIKRSMDDPRMYGRPDRH